MNTALGENRERLRVNGKEYTILKLLGKGKGGYSYLAHDGAGEVVLKQIHHEPCDYYQFGDMVRTLSCGPYTVELFMETDSQTVVYAIMDQADAQAVWPMLKEPKPTLAAISGVDWNRELSPWPAPKVFRGSGDFSGEGPSFLDALTGRIVPSVEAQLGFAPVSRAVAGYSLAGLFALWSVFQTDMFDRAVSVSGSLWFDGFIDRMNSYAPPSGLRQICLSLGDREKNARNQRMAAVEDCTRRAAELLRKWNIPVIFEMNPGGHFQNIPGRIVRGIDQLMGPAH